MIRLSIKRLTLALFSGIGLVVAAGTSHGAVINVNASANWEVHRGAGGSVSYNSPSPSDSVLIPIQGNDGVYWDFDLSGIPNNAVVSLAQLRFDPINLTARLNPQEHFAVTAYGAASTITSAPLQQPTLGTYQYGVGVVPSPTFMDLSPTAVQNLVASTTNSAKIYLFNDTNNLSGGAYSLYAAQVGYPPIIQPNPNLIPQLSIVYTVPEPSCLAFIGCGSLLLIRKRRST